MKKIRIKLATLVLILLLAVPMAAAQLPPPILERPIIAAQYYEVGKVSIHRVDDVVTVVSKVWPGYMISELHIAYGDELSDIPQTNSGNPKVGNFPVSIEFENPVPKSEASIQLEEDSPLPRIWAVHVVVIGVGEEALFEEETGWADGPCFNEDNWATYIEIGPIMKMGPSFDQGTIVQDGDTVHIDAINDGWESAHNVRVDLYVPLIGGQPAFEVGWSDPPHPLVYDPGHTFWGLHDIASKTSKRIEFTVLDTVPGQYELTVVISCDEGTWVYHPKITLQ